MIRSHSHNQLTLPEFDWPFQAALDEKNRWVTLSRLIPWDALSEPYCQKLSVTQGRPAKDARLVIGAVIIKHKLCLSDEETVFQIQENPYLQYFVGLPGYQMKAPFAPSLLVEVRKRMGQGVFDRFYEAIIEQLDQIQPRHMPHSSHDDDDSDNQNSSTAEEGSKPTHQGKLILDGTVVEQAIRYPTDLSLLNEGRELTETLIDILHANTTLKKKPRTYREKAHSAYLAIAKQRRPSSKVIRKGIRQQCQYLRRNLGHIETLLTHWPEGTQLPIPNWLLHRYWVIQHLYQQQWEMYQTKTKRCDHRIVSISQPQVRPIVRGKQNKPVEFGAKLSVSLTDTGLAHVDELRWNAFNEGKDLKGQVEAYKERTGYYPESLLADPLYGTRDNRKYLKQKGIHFAGKPLGRPKKVTDQNRAELKQEKKQRREDYRQRIPIEGKFGQGKHAYQLGYIRAKRADTSVAWINSIFLVMNLMVLLKIFFAPWKQVMPNTLLRVSCYGQTLRRYFDDNPARLSLMPV